MTEPDAKPETTSGSNQSHCEVEPPLTKRRNLGRKARHRKKKLQEIEAVAAAAALDQNPKGDLATRAILPTDRDYVWPAVQELCQLTPTDGEALLGQLGYLPGNALQVVSRVCDAFPNQLVDDKAPLVLKLYPLVLRDETDGTKRKRKRQASNDKDDKNKDDSSTKKNPLMEPFPTIFWVTNPRIRALISRLELQNLGIQYEQRLKNESETNESMKQAHQQYGQERLDTITEQDWKWIQSRKWENAFATSRGVAGIRNFEAVKCLHAHAAHYWSGCTENVVGKWVATEVVNLLKEEGNGL